MTGWGVGVWIPGQAGDDDFGAGDEGSEGRGMRVLGAGGWPLLVWGFRTPRDFWGAINVAPTTGVW